MLKYNKCQLTKRASQKPSCWLPLFDWMSLTKWLNNNWFKEDLVSVYCLATSSQKEAISRTVSGWHVWILLRILTVQKLWITSEIIHALRKKGAARSKQKKSPTDHQQQKYRELRAKAKTLIRENREIYLSSIESYLSRKPIRSWSFSKLNNKTQTFPETMSSGDNNQQGPQALTP